MAVAALMALGDPGWSQPGPFDPRLQPGVEVRVWSKRMNWSPRKATVDSARNDILFVTVVTRVLREAETRRYRIPLSEIEILQVWVKQPVTSAGFGRQLLGGGLVGAALGAAWGAIAAARCESTDEGHGCDLGIIVGPMIGGLVGIAIAAMLGGTPQFEWVTLDLP